jgi:hypothetical protein
VDDAVVGQQMTAGRALDPNRFELDRRQPFEQPFSTADDPRCDHEPELVDDVCGKKRLRHRDAGVYSDVATRLALQVLDEIDQAAGDRGRIGPVRERRGCCDVLHHTVDERRERLDLTTRPEG